MKVKFLRDCGGKAAGSVHVLTRWAAMNFIRMRAALRVCDACGDAPIDFDRHACKQFTPPLNRMMPRGTTR